MEWRQATGRLNSICMKGFSYRIILLTLAGADQKELEARLANFGSKRYEI